MFLHSDCLVDVFWCDILKYLAINEGAALLIGTTDPKSRAVVVYIICYRNGILAACNILPLFLFSLVWLINHSPLSFIFYILVAILRHNIFNSLFGAGLDT